MSNHPSVILITSLCAMIGIAMPVAAAGAASFAGSQSCTECHQQEYGEWSGSHHDLAMQVATEATVLGNFADATYTAYGVRSRFFKKNGDYYVSTEGPDGALQDFKIDYTFGVYPLQQYLIAFPGGRYQALGLAWDTRPKDQGGQRWFHLYPNEHIAPGDVLHWTEINQNWNYMCADCHSTDLRRQFDFENDRYETVWSEIDVSCEACHGPGSKHVAWARAGKAPSASYGPLNGLEVSFDERKDRRWALEPGAVSAAPSTQPTALRTEVETCGRCHSRRAPLGDAGGSGKPILDNYRVALLTDDLYHADGQIKDEVYVYGSFLQSKMYRAGVTCSDCHNPHSLKLKAEGNKLCSRCHLSEAFDTPAHHFHTSGTAGSQCVACHAPESTYMVVDPRRDHSFRIPRPDLSAALGVPNACSGCHADKTAEWAANKVVEWHGPARGQSPHYGEVLAAGRRGEPGGEQQLMGITRDPTQPGIVRATALDILGRTLNQDSFAAIHRGLQDEDALVRLAALGSLEAVGPRERVRFAFPLVEDPVRAVRLEAARLLAPVPLEALPAEPRKTLVAAFAEYEKVHKAIADRPESLTSLANFYRDRGEMEIAEATYREAIRRHPSFGPAYVNLADLYRFQGRDGKGEEILRAALRTAPEQADILHAYGLLSIRHQRYAEAAKRLGQAAELRPDIPRYAYIHALALQKIGDAENALVVLRAAHHRHPNDRDILIALATMSRDRGDLESAVKYAKALVKLAPTEPEARQLLESLQAQQR
ncbi:MAG: tetratricopeptide repeat protein [Gammaproteobacteria bacterium]|nr:tetratricopeptide repeat protein [Gammaproteobacteria bacterium]NCF80028.1 tetratricopeptide repeat protein [Pseudomonadota bacterium]